MINPNKTIKVKRILTIVDINPSTCGFTAVSDLGDRFDGWLDQCAANPKRFKVGDKVKVGVKYSIMLESYIIKKLTKIRAVA